MSVCNGGRKEGEKKKPQESFALIGQGAGQRGWKEGGGGVVSRFSCEDGGGGERKRGSLVRFLKVSERQHASGRGPKGSIVLINPVQGCRAGRLMGEKWCLFPFFKGICGGRLIFIHPERG